MPRGLAYYTAATCSKCGGPTKQISPEWLRARRLASGLTLTALAKRLGLSKAYLCDVELGRRRATPQIAAGYNALKEKP